MIVTWILGGLIVGGILSAILKWWNEIVEWVENVFDNISSLVKTAWSYLTIKAGDLVAYIMEIFSNGDIEIKKGPREIRITSREQLVELAKEGRIPMEGVDKLWKGEPFTITIKDND